MISTPPKMQKCHFSVKKMALVSALFFTKKLAFYLVNQLQFYGYSFENKTEDPPVQAVALDYKC